MVWIFGHYVRGLLPGRWRVINRCGVSGCWVVQILVSDETGYEISALDMGEPSGRLRGLQTQLCEHHRNLAAADGGPEASIMVSLLGQKKPYYRGL